MCERFLNSLAQAVDRRPLARIVNGLEESNALVGWTRVEDEKEDLSIEFRSTVLEDRFLHFMESEDKADTYYVTTSGYDVLPFRTKDELQAIIRKDITCTSFNIFQLKNSSSETKFDPFNAIEHLVMSHKIFSTAAFEMVGEQIVIDWNSPDGDTCISLGVVFNERKIELQGKVVVRAVEKRCSGISENLMDIVFMLERLLNICPEDADSDTIFSSDYSIENWTLQFLLKRLRKRTVNDSENSVILNRERGGSFFSMFENGVSVDNEGRFCINPRTQFNFNHVDPKDPEKIVVIHVDRFSDPFLSVVLYADENSILMRYKCVISHQSDVMNIEIYSENSAQTFPWFALVREIRKDFDKRRAMEKMIQFLNTVRVEYTYDQSLKIMTPDGGMTIVLNFIGNGTAGCFHLEAKNSSGTVLFDIKHFHHIMLCNLAKTLYDYRR